jgi:hypothetical protein
MEYRSVNDIYNANDRVHEKLAAVLSSVSDDAATVAPDGEEWSVAQIAEHVSIVEGGISRICAKLLSKAEANGQRSGPLDLAEFVKKADGIADVKLEAPDMVRPSGSRSIAESLEVMAENRKAFEQLKEKFEMFDCSGHKFPHPYLGDLSALEWLALAGGHKVRHIRQIKRVIEKTQNGI